ncbi:MAG: glycyl-radical enzyme activating protein, partial [Clostridia bacterium]|nr:glycyl-radical enzyme activating protein [Clostridia bacterium]
MSELTAPIFDIRRCSLADGPGVRTTFFFKGCSLHCAWCHNPESQKREPQRIRYQNRCTGCGTCVRHCPSNALAVIGDGSLNYMEEYCTYCGKCSLYCPHDAVSIAGEEKTVRELFDIACQDIEYFGDDGGITVSGGECMLYPGFLYEFLSVCRRRGIRTAVDTAGFVPWNA